MSYTTALMQNLPAQRANAFAQPNYVAPNNNLTSIYDGLNQQQPQTPQSGNLVKLLAALLLKLMSGDSRQQEIPKTSFDNKLKTLLDAEDIQAGKIKNFDKKLNLPDLNKFQLDKLKKNELPDLNKLEGRNMDLLNFDPTNDDQLNKFLGFNLNDLMDPRTA